MKQRFNALALVDKLCAITELQASIIREQEALLTQYEIAGEISAEHAEKQQTAQKMQKEALTEYGESDSAI